jgi:hypothetical protein
VAEGAATDEDGKVGCSAGELSGGLELMGQGSGTRQVILGQVKQRIKDLLTEKLRLFQSIYEDLPSPKAVFGRLA